MVNRPCVSFGCTEDSVRQKGAIVSKNDWNFLCGSGMNKTIELRVRIRYEDRNVNPTVG